MTFTTNHLKDYQNQLPEKHKYPFDRSFTQKEGNTIVTLYFKLDPANNQCILDCKWQSTNNAEMNPLLSLYSDAITGHHLNAPFPFSSIQQQTQNLHLSPRAIQDAQSLFQEAICLSSISLTASKT